MTKLARSAGDVAGERSTGTAGAVGLEFWRAAMRWRRQVDKALSPVGLTFAQWLVLESTYGLIVETGDATNQAAVAVRMELDKMTVSQVMTTLDERGLVDRGPDLTGRAYRIWVTSSGQRALSKGRERVEAASLAALGPHHGRLGKALQVRAAELQ